jgi:hypothetical protein
VVVPVGFKEGVMAANDHIVLQTYLNRFAERRGRSSSRER